MVRFEGGRRDTGGQGSGCQGRGEIKDVDSRRSGRRRRLVHVAEAAVSTLVVIVGAEHDRPVCEGARGQGPGPALRAGGSTGAYVPEQSAVVCRGKRRLLPDELAVSAEEALPAMARLQGRWLEPSSGQVGVDQERQPSDREDPAA
eukprot:186876-Hanusia_phi.AAC.3